MTLQQIINRAYRLMQVTRDPTADEIADGLETLQLLLVDLFSGGMGGLWRDVDISADYTAKPNDRIRILDGYSVTITLPEVDEDQDQIEDGEGGWRYPPPRQFSRVLVNGTAQAFYLYSKNMSDWVSLLGLTTASDNPLGRIYDLGLAAMLAVELAPEFDGKIAPQTAARAIQTKSNLLHLSSEPRRQVEYTFF